MIFERVRNSACGFVGKEPFICCPAYISKNFGRTVGQRSSIAVDEDQPWIWSRIKKVHKQSSSAKRTENIKLTPKANRITKPSARADYDVETTSAYENDVINFEDPITHKNCPQSFYEEFYEADGNPEVAEDDHHDGGGNEDVHNADSEEMVHHHHHHYHHHHHTDHCDHTDSSVDDSHESTHHHQELHPQHIFPHFHNYDFGDWHPYFPQQVAPVTYKPTLESRKFDIIPKSPTINSEKCGISVGTRIIGGVDSIPGQFPWIVRVAYLNTSSLRLSHRCSGSVISDVYVLTAAHCVINLVTELQLSHIRVGDMEAEQDCISKPCKIQRNFKIDKVTAHPNYDKPKYANDVALVRLRRPANARVSFGTICLPVNKPDFLESNLIGRTAIVAGWSTNSEGVETKIPSVKYIQLPISNTTECAITYAKFSTNFNNPIVITPSQMCAQGRPMMDVCRGDSGGPLMAWEKGRYTLLGLVSFGPTICGVSNFPGVYTRVSSFMDWIVANIKQ